MAKPPRPATPKNNGKPPDQSGKPLHPAIFPRPNPRLQAGLRWQRSKRYGWDGR